ncbi:MAG: hypothetical protein MK108_15625 [Mariniblastus sp.]|nr:hypothetical protein [Mariniblastus sp.]
MGLARLIEFESVIAKPPVTARSRIDPDGSFGLGTFHKADGALPVACQIASIPSEGMNAIGGQEERPGSMGRPELHPK